MYLAWICQYIRTLPTLFQFFRIGSCDIDFAGPLGRSIKQLFTAEEILQQVFRFDLEDIDRRIMHDAKIESFGSEFRKWSEDREEVKRLRRWPEFNAPPSHLSFHLSFHVPLISIQVFQVI
jgi:hypothetical protein